MTAAERRAAAATRRAEAAERKAAREAARAEKQEARQVERIRKQLARAGAGKGIKPRLAAGISAEAIARDIATVGDAALVWESWLSGPVGTPIAALFEKYDGPLIYKGALELVQMIEAGMRKAGLLAS